MSHALLFMLSSGRILNLNIILIFFSFAP
jgi:hypothetical protein